jgi:nitrile hydratase
VYLMAVALMRRGLFTLDELRDAIERMPPAEYLAASYYERWLAAIERLLVEKGTLAEGELDAAVEGQRR